ncbi:MAG: hypothetical protein KF841_11470 [Phycisphaerae bacterium]|nr:hypothetical protein [Phycisphaerae bacterium]
MWKEYTRESPARPGWALAAMVVTFAATLVLAQWTTSSRRVSYVQEPAGWPIKFRLPESLHWSHARGVIKGSASKDARVLAFIGFEPEIGRCILAISCRASAGPIGIGELLGHGFRMFDGRNRPIRVGPLKGVLMTESHPDEGEILRVQAWIDDGLEIVIELHGEGHQAALQKLMKELCDSVELRPAANPSP